MLFNIKKTVSACLWGLCLGGPVQAAPADCIASASDGTGNCSAPRISPLQYGYCSTTGLIVAEAMEERCYKATIGVGNKIDSEDALSSFLGCIMVLGPEHPPAPPALKWMPVGASEYSYNCGTMNATAAFGDVEMSGYGVINGYPYGGLFINRFRVAECAQGFVSANGADGKLAHCVRPTTSTCERVGDPISIASGEQTYSETDFSAPGLFPLEFKRSYTNLGFYSPVAAGAEVHAGFGNTWRHSYDRRIFFENSNFVVASALRPSGLVKHFRSNGNEVLNQDGAGDRLTAIIDSIGKKNGWLYVDANGVTETYDAHGLLLRISARNGQTQTLTYSTAQTSVAIAPVAGLLLSVSDQFGRHLNFTYDRKSKMATMTTPRGQVFNYEFDALENLRKVTFPDGKSKTYFYNDNSTFASNGGPYGLTGIVDENGIRVSNFSYRDGYWNTPDITEEAGGVGRYVRTNSGNTVSITDPLGTQRNYVIATINGVQRVTSQSQPDGAGCAAASQNATFDNNGNFKTRTDFNGSITSYQFDLARNVETKRIEAFGTVQARTTTTEWHPTYRLAKRIAEPLLITTMTYDGAGNVLTRTYQPTSDANGNQGFAAATNGAARIWTYTYNAVGQVLTFTGPRTDVTDSSTTTYEATSGNVHTVTNSGGQVTTFNEYDADGRVTMLTDPNGTVTTTTYAPRGWLQSTMVKPAGSADVQTTSYGYDNAGQLKTVTSPAGEAMTFVYDGAHRLIEVKDSLNNKISYTLDKMGNHTAQTVSDPMGALTLSVSRTFDALNRLQNVTGATH